MTTDIAGLVRRSKEYDREAFAELYHCSVGPVYRYLSARVNSRDVAEELTQEVFLAALSGIAGLRASDEAGLFGWLFRIARFKLADHMRQRYRQPSVGLDEAEELQGEGPLPEEEA